MQILQPLGSTFSIELDGVRLADQAARVYTFMSSGAWHTLREISAATNAPEASASARLRDLRTAGVTVERERVGDRKSGCWRYRIATTEGIA